MVDIASKVSKYRMVPNAVCRFALLDAGIRLSLRLVSDAHLNLAIYYQVPGTVLTPRTTLVASTFPLSYPYHG